MALIQGLARPTCPAASPRDAEPRLGWESSSCSGRTEREGGCLGFRITANHHGIKMFTGRGGISSERMILMLLFLPLELSLDSLSIMEWGDRDTLVMKCVRCIFVLMYSTFILMIFSTFRSSFHVGSLNTKTGSQEII